jgi:hypothetical protein
MKAKHDTGGSKCAVMEAQSLREQNPLNVPSVLWCRFHPQPGCVREQMLSEAKQSLNVNRVDSGVFELDLPLSARIRKLELQLARLYAERDRDEARFLVTFPFWCHPPR